MKAAPAFPRQGWLLSDCGCWHWLRFDGFSLCHRMFNYRGRRFARPAVSPANCVCETCAKRLAAMKGKTR